jgi:hypothetical protein
MVLLLHFPFEGYVTEVTYTVPAIGVRCPGGIEAMREMGAEAYNSAITACSDKTYTKELPPEDWRSSGAIIYWFASPLHSFISIMCIFAVGVIWGWAVKSPLKES